MPQTHWNGEYMKKNYVSLHLPSIYAVYYPVARKLYYNLDFSKTYRPFIIFANCRRQNFVDDGMSSLLQSYNQAEGI